MGRDRRGHYRAVVVGVSMGGVEALRELLGSLPRDFPLPVIIVHHMSPDAETNLAALLNAHSVIRVKEADEGERLRSGTAYLAPPNYHLLVEKDGITALSVDAPVNFARPSVDVLFESAAEAFGSSLIGVILTGAGADGSRGAKMVKDRGGLVIIQDPVDAQADSMPRSAIAAADVDHILPLREIGRVLSRLAEEDPCGPEKGSPSDEVRSR